MNRTPSSVKEVGRRQLDRRLEQVRLILPALRPPSRGWVATLRTALGMTQADLAARMDVSQQAIGQLEERETDGSTTVKALREAARALGGELVYAIVPERPISETLEERADRLARQMTASLRHTMRLEDQETDLDLEERTREIARELLASPSRFWSAPDDDG